MMSEEWLGLLIRLSGIGFLALAVVHVPIAKRLDWSGDVKSLTPENQTVFHSHVFFICFGMILLGLALTLVPSAFVERTALGKVVALMLLVFWSARLVRQWTAFPWELWQGKRFETMAHVTFTLVWLALVVLFGLLTRHQFQ